jgi:mRNA interferase MazF
MRKDFDKWNDAKKQINAASSRPPFVSEREIWWCSLGINIGREQDGRGDSFERPAVVIKTLSPDTCIVLPLSTKRRLHKFQSEVTHGNMRGFALLDQVRVLDTKRLRRKIGTASQSEFDAMINKLKGVL